MDGLYYRYLERCQNFNELNNLPEKGWEWHHTLPQCLFGDQPFGLWLTKEQHAIASVLQSYAFGTCCVTGMMKEHLPEKWHEHFRFWRAKPMQKINKEKTKEERQKQGRKSMQHPNVVASRFRENYSSERMEQRREWGRNSHTPESRIDAGKKGGSKSKGKSWWTDGVNFTTAHECPGESWVPSQPPSRQSCYTPEANQKRRESLSGEKNPMFGEKHSKNNLEKMSVAMTGQLHWVNSQGKTCRSRECPGPGWQRGRKWRPQ
jgi:hypothetical protein